MMRGMDTDALDVQLMLVDALASQGRMNDAVSRVLYAVQVTLTKADEQFAEQREDIGAIAHECSLLNQRVESLTQTVGRLMQIVEPLPAELHSVRVPDA